MSRLSALERELVDALLLVREAHNARTLGRADAVELHDRAMLAVAAAIRDAVGLVPDLRPAEEHDRLNAEHERAARAHAHRDRRCEWKYPRTCGEYAVRETLDGRFLCRGHARAVLGGGSWSSSDYVVPVVFRDRTAQEDLVDRVAGIVDAEREDEPGYQASDLDVELALEDVENGLGFDDRRDQEDARRWLISKGVYRAISEAALALRCEFVRGRERWGRADFRLDGVAYVFEQHLRYQKGASS